MLTWGQLEESAVDSGNVGPQLLPRAAFNTEASALGNIFLRQTPAGLPGLVEMKYFHSFCKRRLISQTTRLSHRCSPLIRLLIYSDISATCLSFLNLIRGIRGMARAHAYVHSFIRSFVRSFVSNSVRSISVFSNINLEIYEDFFPPLPSTDWSVKDFTKKMVWI